MENIGNLGDGIPQITDNNNGTITGGFISITSGRYRNVFDIDIERQVADNHCNMTCTGPTSQNHGCVNIIDCSGSTNTRNDEGGGGCKNQTNCGCSVVGGQTHSMSNALKSQTYG